MSLLARWLGQRPSLRPDQQAALAAYRAAPAPESKSPVETQRLVVVDVETSGLDPRRDRLLAIGAVGVRDGAISFGDAFEAVLRQEQASDHDNILVHGIGGTAQRSGMDPADALARFLSYAGKAPLVAFNAGFDRMAIDRALASALGARTDNTWLDVAELAPAVFPEHADRAQTLDEWAGTFGLVNPARHNAVADALVTAQLLLITMDRASRTGARRLHDLAALSRARRWLAR